MGRKTALAAAVFAIAVVVWATRGPGSGDPGDVTVRTEPAGDLGSARRLEGYAPRHVETAEAIDVLTLGALSEPGAWRRLREGLAGAPPERAAAARERAHVSLATLPRPMALWRAGSEPFRVAALVADERTCEVLLELLDDFDDVVMKLPLTEERDDLVFLGATVEAVRREGNAEQRGRLARWLEAALSRETDAETRARLRAWLEGGES